MDRAKTAYKHWRYEQDAQGLVWLTFDKQGESANTFSREALDELLRRAGRNHGRSRRRA